MRLKPSERLLPLLEGVRRSGDGWSARCPAHDDKHPSLSVRETADDTVLVRCHAGCETQAILDAVGLKFSDLFPERLSEEAQGRYPKISDIYTYTDDIGTPLYQVRRTVDKQFPQFRADGQGNWTKGLGGITRVPYRLPWLLAAARDGGMVFLVEGEKDVHTMEELGYVATTTGGAKSWRNEYAGYFRGARVVILPDNDEPGRKYAEEARDSLAGTAARVTVLPLPDLRPGGDVSDWVAAGGTREGLERLLLATQKARPLTSAEATKACFDDLERRASGELVGLPWCPEWQELGRVLGPIERGSFTVVAARPSIGKTVVALQEQAFLCDRGHRVVFVSRELTPERLIRRHLVREGASMENLRLGKLSEDDRLARDRYFERQKFWNVLYDHVSRTVPEIARVAIEYQADCVIIDYIQRLAYNEDREYAALTRLANELQDFTLQTDIPLICLCQLSRPGKGQDHRFPQMSDLRGSGAIEERAANIVLLHREWTTKKQGGQEIAGLMLDQGYFIVAKNADGEAGLRICTTTEGRRMRIVERADE